jgi:Protein of unknown function (DUF3558)
LPLFDHGDYGARVRGLLALVTALGTVLLAAGCGAQVDTAKRTYPRTTVPAGQQPTGGGDATGTAPPNANDPAFTPEKLRTVDPCPLLDEDVLDDLGTPAETTSRTDFGTCANYMKDEDSRDLNLTLTLGDSVSNSHDADENIGGLPAVEDPLDTGEACFVTVITSTSPNLGISIQAGGAAEDLCGAARTVMTSVVDRVRSDPPVYDTAKGTLIDVDPCTFFPPADLTRQLGGEVTTRPSTIHWCTWSGPSGSVGVWLRIGPDPAIVGDGPVGLGGGVTAYQDKSGAVSCSVTWKHRPYAGDDVEIVQLTFDSTSGGPEPCAPAVDVAKALVPKLPAT